MNKPMAIKDFLAFVLAAERFREVLTLETFFTRLVEEIIDWTDPVILGELRCEITGALNMG